ncbi:MAG: hypothetical protein IJB41_00265 [Clostridia bacterium]|nr:hypothetical protein [Clostridia bacterium]
MCKGHSAAWALAAEGLAMALLGAAAGLCGLILSGRALGAAHGGCMWLLQPLLGAYMSLRCAKKGVPAILAWLPAPACFAGAYWAVVGMPPHAGAAMLCAVAGIVGASAGEVLLKRSKN